MHTKMRWRCADGHEWSATLVSIRTRNFWCPKCATRGNAKLIIKDAHAAALARGGVCLSSEYTNNYTKMRWRCADGHEWSAPLVSIRNQHTWCPKCVTCGKAKLTIKDAHAAALARGGVCLSRIYTDGTAKMQWRCSKGHEWAATLHNIRTRNFWCPKCRGRVKPTIDDARAAAQSRGGVCLSTVYTNSYADMRWRCAHGHEWGAPLHNIKIRQFWCPGCSKATLSGHV